MHLTVGTPPAGDTQRWASGGPLLTRARYWVANRFLMHRLVQTHFVGKHLLVGITYMDEHHQLIEKRQLHGTIARINREEGLVLCLADGDEFHLPPDVRPIRRARPGEYRLRSTGEIVIDPDLTGCWIATRKP